jgi:hypothetical protein
MGYMVDRSLNISKNLAPLQKLIRVLKLVSAEFQFYDDLLEINERDMLNLIKCAKKHINDSINSLQSILDSPEEFAKTDFQELYRLLIQIIFRMLSLASESTSFYDGKKMLLHKIQTLQLDYEARLITLNLQHVVQYRFMVSDDPRSSYYLDLRIGPAGNLMKRLYAKRLALELRQLKYPIIGFGDWQVYLHDSRSLRIRELVENVNEFASNFFQQYLGILNYKRLNRILLKRYASKLLIQYLFKDGYEFDVILEKFYSDEVSIYGYLFVEDEKMKRKFRILHYQLYIGRDLPPRTVILRP